MNEEALAKVAAEVKELAKQVDVKIALPRYPQSHGRRWPTVVEHHGTIVHIDHIGLIKR